MYRVALTLDAVNQVLEILGHCQTDAAAIPGLPGDTLVATMRHPLIGEVRRRVATASVAAAMDTSRWAEAELPGTSLLVLAETESERKEVDPVLQRISEAGRVAEIQLWGHFLSQFVNLPRIRERYEKLHTEYRATEGEDFIYIDPTIVDEDTEHSSNLSDWIQRQESSGEGGIIYLVAEYGEGKTSFCLDYVFQSLEDPAMAGGVPLLFSLSEMEAGSLQSFVTERLHNDYGLSLSHSDFRLLCDLGVFIPVFDAFDQMQHGAAGSMRVERDYMYLEDIAPEGSPVFVTCRLDFYDQYVNPLRDKARSRGEHSKSSLLSLRGFDDQDIRQRLQEFPVLLAHLTDPNNIAVLDGIHRKPLMLHVITRHPDMFIDLLDEQRAELDRGSTDDGRGGRVTEFGVFNLLYESWLDQDFVGLMSREEGVRLCRAIAARVQLEGMNVPIPFSRLVNDEACVDLLDTPEKREAVLEDLKLLPLLNQEKLRSKDESLVVFRFNAYLEFLCARFILDELDGEEIVDGAFMRLNSLTWETRHMIVPELAIDDHAGMLGRSIEGSSFKHFDEVMYQGSNGLTLVLDKLQDREAGRGELEGWERLLHTTRLRHGVLRLLDARGADLRDLDFSHCDLRDADFSYSNLRHVKFDFADLDGAQFEETGALLTTVLIHRQDDKGERWLFAGGTENGMLIFLDSASASLTRSRPHREAITALAMHRDRRLFSASKDKAISSTELDDLNIIRRYPLAMGALRAMLVVDDGSTVIVGGDRRSTALQVRNRDGSRFHYLALPPARGAVVTSLAVDEPRGLLFVGDGDGDVYVFDGWQEGAAGREIGTSLKSPIRSLIALRDGSLLVVADSGLAQLLDTEGIPQRDVPSGDSMEAACYASDVDTLFWLDVQRLMKWDRRGPATRPTAIALLPGSRDRTRIACSTDGTFLAAGGNQLLVWRDSPWAGLEVIRQASMLLDCDGMTLEGSRGLTEETIMFLQKRGAIRLDATEDLDLDSNGA